MTSQVESGILMGYFGGELSLKNILYAFFVFICFSSRAETNLSAEVPEKVNIEKSNKLNKLPDVDLEKYKGELLSYQELQRKNMMLKLQAENQKLEGEINKKGSSTPANIGSDTVYLMSIMTIPRKGLCAIIFDGEIRRVCKGDFIRDDSIVSDITGDYLELRDVNDLSGSRRKMQIR